MRGERREVSRRAVLWGAAVGSAVVASAVHVWAWARSLVPNVRYEPPPKRRLGSVDDFPLGWTELSDHRLFVVRDAEGLRAVSAVCTHLGCTVGRKPDGFHCPCHGSTFDTDGRNTGGPAPRPLPWHELTLGGGNALVVDLSTDVPPDTKLAVAASPDEKAPQ